MYLGQVATQPFGASSPPQQPATGWFGQLIGAAGGIWGQVSANKAQKQAYEAQIEAQRAQAELARQSQQQQYELQKAMLDQQAALYSGGGITPGLPVSMASMGMGLNSNVLMIGGAVIGGILLIGMLGKKR